MKSICIVTLVLLLGSCTSKNAENTSNSSVLSKNTTLIFVDKSISVDVNKSYISNKFKQALTKIVEENIKKADDKLEMYYIHENTAKAHCFTVISRTSQENTAGMNETDKEATNTNYDLSIRKERLYILQQASKYLMAQNTNRSNLQTDIWASLPIIAKESKEKATVKVYYFSDMVESMNGLNRRDFHVRPPKSNEEANQWAENDADRMKDLALNISEITMILPFEPMSSSKENSPYVTEYWQKLFKKLGTQNIIEL